MFIVHPTTSTNDISCRRSSVRDMKLKYYEMIHHYLQTYAFYKYIRSEIFYNILHVLHETFKNFNQHYINYIGKISSKRKLK